MADYEALDFVARGEFKTIVETYPLAEAPKDTIAWRAGQGSMPRCPDNEIADPSRRRRFRADHADIILGLGGMSSDPS